MASGPKTTSGNGEEETPSDGGTHDGNTKPLPICHVAASGINYACCQYAHCSECPLNPQNQ